MYPKSEALQMFAEQIVKNKKKVRITNYIKSAGSSQRLTEGKSNLVIDTNLNDFSIRARESISFLENVSLDEKKMVMNKFNVDLQIVEDAIDELLNSLKNKLYSENTSSNSDKDDKYYDYGGNIVQNKETGDIYFSGRIVEEQEIIKPTYKTVNSKPKTLVKDHFRKQLSTEIKRWKLNFNEMVKVKLVD